MAKITIDLTDKGMFNGLYETIWLNEGLDEMELEYLSEENNLPTDEIDVSIDCKKYLKEIAENYIFFMIGELEGVMTIEDIYSPREYNFDTDHIILNWENKKLSEKEMIDKLDNFIEENTTDWESFESNVFEAQNMTEKYNNLVEYKYKGENI